MRCRRKSVGWRSAPAPAGSNSASGSRCRPIAPSPMSSARRRPSRCSRHGCGTVAYTARPCSTISASSTAGRGAGGSISSAPAIHASRSPSTVAAAASPTNGTSGRMSRASSTRRGRPRCSSKMSQVTSRSAFPWSPGSYDVWASRLLLASFRRARWAQHMKGGDSSCWPTPTVYSGAGRMHTLRARGRHIYRDTGRKVKQVPLPFAAVLWSYRTSLRGRSTSSHGAASSPPGRGLNPRLGEMLQGWPAGWTDPSSPVTGFAAWQRRMRSRLSALRSQPGPPAGWRGFHPPQPWLDLVAGRHDPELSRMPVDREEADR